jgi:hypothetical protein
MIRITINLFEQACTLTGLDRYVFLLVDLAVAYVANSPIAGDLAGMGRARLGA